MGNQQLVEIAKAMSRNAKVLILDEPTSSLSLSEAGQLFDLLRQLRDQGLGIVFVSHHLEEVFDCATGSRCCATASMWEPCRRLNPRVRSWR